MPATLDGTLPELRAAFDQLMRYAKNHGIGASVADFGGLRSQADTTRIENYRLTDYNAAKNAGAIRPDTTLQQFRPIAPFGSSWHNYGAAFDVRIDSRPAGMTIYAAQKLLGSLAPSLGLRWGGNFKNADPPHFELAISLDEAKKRYAALSRTAPAPAAPPSVPPSSLEYSAYDEEPGSALDYAGDYYGELEEEGDSGNAFLLLGLIVAGVVAIALVRRHVGT